MARKKGVKGTNRLTEEMLNQSLENGYYGDGNHLFLRVLRDGQYRSWVFQYKSPKTGKKRELGIGAERLFSLNEARRRAEKLRKQINLGLDPAELKSSKAPQDRSAPFAVTFEDAARKLIEIKKDEWKDRRGEKIWLSSLENHVFPYIGSTPVNMIGDDDVLAVLKPIWQDITETATRIRQRIEIILDYAKAEKWRRGDNPARWSGVLQFRLPNPAPILRRKQQHHYALPIKKIPKTMAMLKEYYERPVRPKYAARLVRFLILTGGRSIEIREAVWEEVNFEEKIWQIPKERMKAIKDHAVPLCDEALEILRGLPCGEKKGLIFQNKNGKVFSDVALSKTLKQASGDQKATIHGLRSTFWDWAAENKIASFHACQSALAHSSRSASDAAYFRSDLFEERIDLMRAWEAFCLAGRVGKGENKD